MILKQFSEQSLNTVLQFRPTLCSGMFSPCGKGHHRFYAFINMGQKNHISSTRGGGEEGEISGYMVCDIECTIYFSNSQSKLKLE